MFIHKSKLGTLDRWTVNDAQHQNHFSVVPEKGGLLTEVVLKGISVLDGYRTEAEILANKHFKNTILAPFPNRLAQGRYTFQGKQYQLPINDVATGNALHGLVYDKPFEIDSFSTSPEGATLLLRYHYQKDVTGFPFEFMLLVFYSIHTETGFQMALSIMNTGASDMPMGLGWHPYFSFGKKIDKLYLQTPQMELVDVNDHLLPTGKRHAFEAFSLKKQLKKTQFDTCFCLNPSKDVRKTVFTLSDTTHTLEIWQSVGYQDTSAWFARPPHTEVPRPAPMRQFNFVQFYTMPDRSSIAIEPMTCAIDAFNNQDGLAILKPQEMLRVQCGFDLKS